MKLTIESTTEIVDVVTATGIVSARVWEGTTDTGIAVQCLITRIAVHKSSDATQFDRELRACADPVQQPRAFAPRTVLP